METKKNQTTPTHNDARVTLMCGHHTLSSLRTLLETKLGDHEANEYAYVIDGVQMLIAKADEEYDQSQIAGNRALVEAFGPALEAGMMRCMSIVDAMKKLEGDDVLRRDIAATALALQHDLLIIRDSLEPNHKLALAKMICADPRLPDYERDGEGNVTLDGQHPGVGNERGGYIEEARCEVLRDAKKKTARVARLRSVK